MIGKLIDMQTVAADRYGFAYGVLAGDDGKFYTCDNGHFFRNGSYAIIGHRYNFDVADYSYATNIDLIDKEAGRKEIQRQHAEQQSQSHSVKVESA